MARTRLAGGGGASAWALVVLGLGFGICLVLTLLFYVQLQGAHQAAEEAEDQLRAFVSSAQESSPEIVSRLDRVAEDGTVVQQLLDTTSGFRSLLTTDAEADLESIRARIDEADLATPLISEMQDLHAEVAHGSERINQLESTLEEARERAEALDEELALVRQRYDESVEELEGELERVRSEFTDYRERVEQMEQELTERVRQVRGEREEEISDLEQQREELRRQADQLRQSLADARRREAAISPPELLRPDGRIASVVEEQNNVYIDLGRQDRIVAGMTFEVFGPNEPIEPDQYDDVRGKATIMVFDVRDDASVARVVRRASPGRNTIEEGDVLINLAYSPDTVYTFYVHGRFNLDGLDDPTAADRERIASIIRQWGGRIADELNYEVDFVVVGAEPPLPEQPPEGTVDTARIRAHQEAQRRYERHHEIVGEARSLDLPVLNQNRLLALVGYYQR